MRRLVEFLIKTRKERGVFTIQECAYETHTCEQSVRNFEYGKAINSKILHYYICKCMQCDDVVADSIIKMFKEDYNG